MDYCQRLVSDYLACLIHRIAGIRRRVSRKVVIVTYELGA